MTRTERVKEIIQNILVTYVDNQPTLPGFEPTYLCYLTKKEIATLRKWANGN